MNSICKKGVGQPNQAVAPLLLLLLTISLISKVTAYLNTANVVNTEASQIQCFNRVSG